MSKLDKEEYKRSVSIVDSLCSQFNSFEEIDEAMRLLYTRLNNPNDERMKEVTKAYDFFEIVTSKSKLLKEHKLSNTMLLSPRFYFYDKAPCGFILTLNLFTKVGASWAPCDFGLYIKEDKNRLL